MSSCLFCLGRRRLELNFAVAMRQACSVGYQKDVALAKLGTGTGNVIF